MCDEKIGEGVTGDDLPGVIKVLKDPIGPGDFNYLRHQIWLCGECCFFYKTGKEIPAESVPGPVYPGECRRRAARALKNGKKWPFVLSIEWCGESTPNDKAIADMKAQSMISIADRMGLKTLSEVKKDAAEALKDFKEEQSDQEQKAVEDGSAKQVS